MTDHDSAGTAAELDALYWQGHRYYRAHEADRALAFLRKQLDEAQKEADEQNQSRCELIAANAQMAAALNGFLAIVNRTDFLAAIAGEVPNEKIKALGEAIRDGLAALTPAAPEHIADAGKMAAPASPSPGLREAVIEECAKVAMAQRVEGDSRPSWNAACASVYAAIRALASRPVSEREGPDWNELRGVAPDATGDQSSEAFIREQRDSWER